MLTPARMTKLKVMVLDQYLEDVMREFSREGSVHILDIKNAPADFKNLEIVSENKTSVRASELLGRIYYLLDILGITEERDFFGSLKKDPKKISWKEDRSDIQLTKVDQMLSGIEKVVIGNSSSLTKLGEERSVVEPKKHILESLSRLKVESSWLGESRFLYFVAGAITPEELDKLEKVLKKESIEHMIKEASNKEKMIIVLVVPKTNRQEVDRILAGSSFDRFSIESGNTEESLKAVRKRLADIEHETKGLEKELRESKGKYVDTLLGLREVVQIEKGIADKSVFTGKTKRVYVLEGWVPQKALPKLKGRIEEVSHGYCVIKNAAPANGEVVPTKLDNPRLFKPFEVLIETFGLPAYKELDPTPILALTFPLFYGLMFGDVGHGLMLALIGMVVMKLAKKSAGTRSLGIIILTCGLFAVLFGFVYGEAFGMGPEKQLEFTEANFGHEFKIPTILPITSGPHAGLPQVNPLENPIGFLTIAVLIGSVHITLGLVMNLLNKINQKDYMGAISGPIPKIWLFGGAVYLFSTYWTNFGLWGDNIGLVILLIPVPLVLILFEGIIHHLPHFDKAHLGTNLGQGGFEVFDTVLVFLSNSVSYTRIFALALVHGGLFLALFSISAPLMTLPYVGWIAWLLVVLIGTVAIIGLESIIVFLHSLRLHYYEWFTKFYGADGVKFAPFRTERSYTKLED